MFVHKKKHRSGRTSVVVVDKSHGKFREIKNFVVASSDSDIADLCRQASEWLRRYGGQFEMDFIDESEKRQEEEETDRVLSNIDSLLINGHRHILDQVYNSIGFNQIDDEMLRHLVIARISQPMSKRATVENLKSYFDEDIELHNIYRYMDKLYNTRLGYSSDRAKKDAHNREEGVARLRKSYASGKITKSQVNKRGYNKFLEISKDVEFIISKEKIAKTIVTIRVRLPKSGATKQQVMLLTPEHHVIEPLFDINTLITKS